MSVADIFFTIDVLLPLNDSMKAKLSLQGTIIHVDAGDAVDSASSATLLRTRSDDSINT